MPLWARLRRGGENDGAGRRSHGREADGRPGGAQRNAARDFARQTQKVGPVTVRAVSPQVKCDRTGARAGAGTGSRVWEKRKAPRCRGDDYESPTAYFLSIKKVGKER